MERLFDAILLPDIFQDILSCFIIPAKPDPLVEAIAEAFKRKSGDSEAINLTQAIERRGGRIVWEHLK